jgi:biotin synthase
VARLCNRANHVRKLRLGDGVHLRGLIEISNHCRRRCTYCGLRGPNAQLERYRMSADEILDAARLARDLEFGTVVLQSGEDPHRTPREMAGIIRRIKSETGLAVTLSLGEHPARNLKLWRRAGADRYLLRFETSDPDLYARLHPDRPDGLQRRLDQLRLMRQMGYEIGGGMMVGLPGQSYESLARDIELCREMDFDMVGLGPCIPNPCAPLGAADDPVVPADDQVPPTQRMSCKALAVTRLLCPEANITATTALATLRNGRTKAIEAGANVIMPNVTPAKYADQYRIYPSKSQAARTARPEPGWMQDCLRQMGRFASEGPGNRMGRENRRANEGMRKRMSKCE